MSFLSYTFHPIPDLGSLNRLSQEGPCRFSLPLSDLLSSHLPSQDGSELHRRPLRAAFSSTLMRHIDNQDFLFAETTSEFFLDPEAVWLRLIRAQPQENMSWEQFSADLAAQASPDNVCGIDTCLDDARAHIFVNDDTNPLPALFIWDVAEASQEADFIPRSVVFGSHRKDGLVYLDFVMDTAIVCLEMLKKFATHVSETLAVILSSPESVTTAYYNISPQLLSSAPTKVDFKEERLALDWLFDNAAQRPDAIAHEIYSSMEQPPYLLTYGDYNRKSNALAHWLVSEGVQFEDKVSLCSIRTPFFYIAMAAILKAGACYVSIDPELPLERKKHIVEDSESRFVFTGPDDKDAFGILSIFLENKLISSVLDRFGDQNICRATLDSLAYLLYTSGTTGKPKGCLLMHRGLYWAMLSFCSLPKPVTNPDTDKRLALASTAFDVHISEIVQSWCLGTRLVSAPRFELLTQLRKHVINIGITHMGMVPSMIEALLQTPDDLPIKYLVSGGEKITNSLLQKWSNLPNLILANFYGPTEVTIGCTSRRVGQNDRKENIGRPFPSCSAYVVDGNLNIVPLGCPGELIIGGPLVARGYHHLPEATAKVFIDFPEPGHRAYHTGDLVRMMPDGSIEIIGRIDLQVKYRGVRIETEGISSILQDAAKPKVELNVSTFISSHPTIGSELLVSFIAIANDTSMVERRTNLPRLTQNPEVRDVLKKLGKAVEHKLPVYMRPAYILPVEFIPLTLNGKTDNKKLGHILQAMDVKELLDVQRGK